MQWLSQQLVQEKSKIVALTLLALFGVSLCSSAASYYPLRLDDPKAVYLTKDKFPVHGDGVADDSDALQQAIDRVQETSNRELSLFPEDAIASAGRSMFGPACGSLDMARPAQSLSLEKILQAFSKASLT